MTDSEVGTGEIRGPSPPPRSQSRKRRCTEEGCHAEIHNIARHLVQVHFMPDHQAKDRVMRANVGWRKRRNSRTSRSYRKCPLCGREIQRYDVHLRRFHNLEKGGADYKRLCSASVRKLAITKRAFDRAERDARRSGSEDRSIFGGAGDALGRATEGATGEALSASNMSRRAIEDLLNGFKVYLSSRDGGQKSQKSARQAARRVERVIGAFNYDVTRLANHRDLLEYFERELIGKLEASTVQVYMTSVQQFLTYTQDDPGMEKALLVIPHIKRWSSSLRRDVVARRMRFQALEQKQIIEPTDIANFNSSSHTKAVIDTLRQLRARDGDCSLRAGRLYPETEFRRIRNFLMTSLLLYNAQRAGPIREMRVCDFRDAERQDSDNSYVVSMIDHKTALWKGPAFVVFSAKLHAAAKAYIQHVLRNTRAGDEGYMFPKYTGEILPSSKFTIACKQGWKDAGVSDKEFTSTRMRKSMATMVLQHIPELSSDLATAMSHSRDTQEKFYALTRHSKQSASVAKATSSLVERLVNPVKDPTEAVSFQMILFELWHFFTASCSIQSPMLLDLRLWQLQWSRTGG